jgi:hypothetical protein
MAQAPRAVRWSRVLLVLTALAPLTVFIAIAGMRLGVWDWQVGYSMLTLRVGLALAALGAFAALGGVIVALGEPRARLMALAGVVLGGATAGLYGLHLSQVGTGILTAPTTSVSAQATTALSDPPAFAGILAQRRQAADAAGSTVFQACAATTVPTQVAPGAAAYALEQAGFDVLGFGVGRADGTREGTWFGFVHDATIRIRPGATDVRVASREARDDGGEACRLVTRIVAELQPGA